MTEPEKLHAGLEYDMWAPEIDALKLRAMTLCRRLNALPKEAKEERTAVMRELFGSVGENAAVMPYFSCDDGKSIFIGKNFLANYNVSILDRAPVRSQSLLFSAAKKRRSTSFGDCMFFLLKKKDAAGAPFFQNKTYLVAFFSFLSIMSSTIWSRVTEP